MKRPESMRDALRNTFATAVSAALLYFGTGLHPIWWLTWFAPLPVLLIAPRTRASTAFALTVIAWMLGGLNLWHYLHGLIRLPAAVVLLFLVIPACVFGVAVVAHRSFVRRGALWSASLCVPAIAVTYEYLTVVLSPHSTFGSIAYSQMDFLAVIQLASVAGVYGITFCVFLVPATIAVAIGRTTATRGKALELTVGVFFGAVILFGVWRQHSAPIVENVVTVALVSSGDRQNLFPDNDAAALKLFASYHDRIRNERNGLIVVMPEKIAAVSDAATPQIDALLKTVADNDNSTIIAGVDRGTPSKRWNEARVYSPGNILRTYHKHHMIPGLEDVDQPGTTRTEWREPSGVWGVQICKDMDFPALSRQYGRDGVGLLLVPAWDFDIDGWLHGRMAILRGVESGFTIARTAKQGLLTVSDNRGRVLAEKTSSVLPFSILLADAPVAHVDTVYARWGDWLAWLNVAILVLIIATARYRQRHSASAK